MKRLFAIALFCLLGSTPAFAQLNQQELLTSLEQAGELVIGVADAMPADKYDFRVTNEVRTFGEQVKHVAGVYANLMSWVRGVSSPKEGNNVFMSLKTKDEIMAALRKTVAENTAALKRMTAARLAGRINTEFFGRVSRLRRANGHRSYESALRADGRVPAFEWHRAAHQPRSIVSEGMKIDPAN
jgi:DinB superfamily